MSRSKRKVISIDEDGVEVPGRLVALVKAHWSGLTGIRISARKGRKGYVPLKVVSFDDAAQLDEIGAEGPEVTPISAARDAYQVAQAEAEDSGGGFFRFQGLAQDEDAGGAVVAFEKAFKVEVDVAGEADEVAEENPTAAILTACASTVERFGALVGRAVEMNLKTQEQTADQLSDLRAQVFEQAKQMRGLDESRLIAQKNILEHEATVARNAELAEKLGAGVAMLAPQLAALLADRVQPRPFASTEPAPQAPPGDAPSSPPASPCAEAAALSRVIERLDEGQRESFLGQFEGRGLEIIAQAETATTQTEFDACVAELFLGAGVTKQQDAAAKAQSWVSVLPPEAQAILVPALMGVGTRLSWPLTAAQQGDTTSPESEQEPTRKAASSSQVCSP